MVARINTTPSLPIIDAVDSLVGQVRKNFPDVPTNIVIALASGRKKRSAVHGHFAPESWVGVEDSPAHEILIGAESLSRGAEEVAATVLHELAHARAHATGVKDTSNNGRYHNKRFKAIGEEMGLALEDAPTHGWTVTKLADGTAETYKVGIEKLAKALTTYRISRVDSSAPTVRNKTKGQIDCGCEDPVTVSLQWFERAGTITHETCGEDFKLVD
jgi:hypothetical protein